MASKRKREERHHQALIKRRNPLNPSTSAGLSIRDEELRESNAKDMPDLISDLPEEIRRLVISRLPLKTAAQTSLLSTRWRDLWRSAIMDMFVEERTIREGGREANLSVINKLQILFDGQMKISTIRADNNCITALIFPP